MDLNPGCCRPGGLLRSSCLTSCVSQRGLPARRGYRAVAAGSCGCAGWARMEREA
ncbi:hypothetical protein DV515_00010517 [Chloebia gouldiae]|uniref:Uncharacterized protein n=1 Tax=Chloebia gouldiae TaxID=44316 RepID=A0A3L8S9L1_CHLGU|nr:hypothetical protein DV515_00010517 [Chloebia gouldiae]